MRILNATSLFYLNTAINWINGNFWGIGLVLTSFLVVSSSFSMRNDQERGCSEEAWLWVKYSHLKLADSSQMSHLMNFINLTQVNRLVWFAHMIRWVISSDWSSAVQQLVNLVSSLKTEVFTFWDMKSTDFTETVFDLSG